ARSEKSAPAKKFVFASAELLKNKEAKINEIKSFKPIHLFMIQSNIKNHFPNNIHHAIVPIRS
ncbi:MAG: hypothetical protein ACREDS_06720, partial [Limisphaerales bacterium]